MRTMRAAILVFAGLLLGGCFSDSGSDGDSLNQTNPESGNGVPTTPRPTVIFKALFQASAGIFPYPTDLFFNGSTDGTLNLPANPFNPAVNAINALDGFSTTAAITARFNGALDPATLTAANVRVIRLVLDNATKAPLIPPAPGGALPQPLAFGTDFSVAVAAEAGSGGGTLVIRPTRPLEASTGSTNIGYLVLLTNGIRNASGVAAQADVDYELVRNQAIAEINAGAATPACTPITNATLNAICRLTFAHLRVGAAVGVSPSSVIVSFGFSTQSTGDSLAAVAQLIGASPAPAILAQPLPGPTGRLNTHDVSASLAGKADIYAGTLTVPYYLSAPSSAAPTAPVTSFWTAAGASPAPGIDPASRNLTRFNPLPAKTADLPIPLLVFVPNAASLSLGQRPVNGWPVAIFQHGLTRNRADAVAIADAFADAGFVVVSIDLPLHGITPTSPVAAFRQAGRELTFDLDVVNNSTLAPGPDGQIDNSGANFVNLSSLLTTRDNLRQGAVDLLTLTRALPTLELTGDTTADIDPDRIHFVGHSLGSIVGGVYASLAGSARTASLLMTGGGVAQTIVDSPAFGPLIVAGLQSQGLIPGTTLFNQFLRDAQTAADAGDPLNYIRALLTAKPVHITQIVGGGAAGWPADQVVPNSSTQRMLDAGTGLIQKVSSVGTNAVSHGYVSFTFGHHGSIIDPSCSSLPSTLDPSRCLATTVEMQRQTVSFAASDGTLIPITDGSVIQP